MNLCRLETSLCNFILIILFDILFTLFILFFLYYLIFYLHFDALEGAYSQHKDTLKSQKSFPGYVGVTGRQKVQCILHSLHKKITLVEKQATILCNSSFFSDCDF